MKVTYDPDVDALYVYFTLGDEQIPPRGVKETIVAKPGVNLDFDHAGHLIGMEVLDAMRVVPGLIGEAIA